MKKRFDTSPLSAGFAACCWVRLLSQSMAARSLQPTEDITIYLNGQKQVATDVNGKVEYPLIDQGTTYVADTCRQRMAG